MHIDTGDIDCWYEFCYSHWGSIDNNCFGNNGNDHLNANDQWRRRGGRGGAAPQLCDFFEVET